MPEAFWLALDQAFVAPDAAPLPAADLEEVDWDRVVLQLTPTMALAAPTTNAPEIWSALASQAEPPAVERLAKTDAVLV